VTAPDHQHEGFVIQPFPIGWFVVAHSDELAVGDVRPLEYFGTALICYRGESGAVYIRDAFCPHLGAHIGFGGRVEGDDVICPFHGWTYGVDGRNVRIPYATRPNAQARLRCWPARESGGLILAWHHPRGVEPTWEVGMIPEFSDPHFVPASRTDFEIHVHPQEVFENSVDLAHFLTVHEAARMPDVDVQIDGPRLTATTTNQLLKSKKGYFEGGVSSDLWGLGIDVARITGVVDTVAVLALTPIDERRVHARFLVTARVGGTGQERDHASASALAQKAKDRVIREFETDLVIWEHKRYEPRPRLTMGEHLVTRFRKWAQQFYDGVPGQEALVAQPDGGASIP
jgi:nitrite reductase/ring-hydroxylating ferredoxin subunit